MKRPFLRWSVRGSALPILACIVSLPLWATHAEEAKPIGQAGDTAVSRTLAPVESPSPQAIEDMGSGSASASASGLVGSKTEFLESFPNLKDYLYQEPPSGFFLGVGISPIGILRDRTMFSLNFFQVHLITEHWDLELLNASYGVTRAETSVYQSNDFDFRTTLKFRLGQIFSLGPMIGYEFVNFPNLGAILMKNGLQTFNESFSSQGMIYGGMISETFHYSDYLLQFNEMAYQESYSVLQTPQGWAYYYDNADVRANPQLIGPSLVTVIEISLLF